MNKRGYAVVFDFDGTLIDSRADLAAGINHFTWIYDLRRNGEDRQFLAGGAYCRDFTQTIVIDGQPQDATGTACRQPDGGWRVVN